VFTGQLVRIADDGTWQVAAETGLPFTTSAAFGIGREQRGRADARQGRRLREV